MQIPMNSYELDQLHREELMQMAEQFRLAREAGQRQRAWRLYNHVLASTGSLLVRWGRTLEERYGTMPELANPPVKSPSQAVSR